VIQHGVKKANELTEKIEKIALCVLEYLYKGEGEINIVLTNDEVIRELNRQFRNIDRPTDVLSFAYNEGELLGEVIISLQTVESQSMQYGNSFQRELEFVLIHGVLHILGYDHETGEDAKVMFDLQKLLLRKCCGEG